MSRILLAACALTLVACAGPPRTIALNFMKPEVTDVQAAEDKAALKALPGVNNVVLEHGRDNTARIQVYVLDGKEAGVMPKVEELGYSRVR